MLFDKGNAYRLKNNVLQSAPLLIDGSIDMDGWTEVDFDCIGEEDVTYCRAIENALTHQGAMYVAHGL